MTNQSKTLKTYTTSDDGEFQLYQKETITINPGITVLIGCNGSGKTTLMQRISRQIKKDTTPNTEIIYIQARDASDVGRHSPSDINFLVHALSSSEGERLIVGLRDGLMQFGKALLKNDDITEIWLLIDSLDSGLDDAELHILPKTLQEVLDEADTPKTVYIILSSNSYELTRTPNATIIDVNTVEPITFDTYEEWLKHIQQSRENKYARYNQRQTI